MKRELKIFYKHIVKLKLIILFIFVPFLSSCTALRDRLSMEEITKVIEADLNERYGTDFIVDSIESGSNLYNVRCHPVDNPTLWFDCMYSDNGTYKYDFYAGTIIAEEENKFFADLLGESFGNAVVRCNAVFIVDEENNTSVCDFIKNGIFTSKKAYEICAADDLSFNVFVLNSSSMNDFEKEYDSLEKITREYVDRFAVEYGLDIYIDIDIHFVDDEYFALVNNYISTGAGNIKQVIDASQSIRVEMGIPTEYVTQDLWLSKEEYILKREEMK